jgi:hypothetical protein
MSSFTWKRPWALESHQQGRETPQDLETRYEGADIESDRVAPAHGTANQFRRSGNRAHWLLLTVQEIAMLLAAAQEA